MGFDLESYEPVEDRLRQFWTDHPYGRVITVLEHHADGDYIMRAEVYVGNELRNDPPTATGYAHDSTSSLPNNMKSSALEVCETSAIGRALANMGYAAKGKRPSREEMQKAPPATDPLPRGAGETGEPPPATTLGEGVTPAGDSPASTEQWERLVHVSGGSTQRAVNRLNKVNGTSYTKETAVAGATVDEIAAAITGEKVA